MIADLIKKDALTGFDLAQDLMIRVKLVHQADNEYVLIVTLHHIASDGWSVGIFVKEGKPSIKK